MTFVLNEIEMGASYIKKLESVVCQVEREDYGADSGIKFYPGCQFWSWMKSGMLIHDISRQKLQRLILARDRKGLAGNRS